MGAYQFIRSRHGSEPLADGSLSDLVKEVTFTKFRVRSLHDVQERGAYERSAIRGDSQVLAPMSAFKGLPQTARTAHPAARPTPRPDSDLPLPSFRLRFAPFQLSSLSSLASAATAHFGHTSHEPANL